MSRYDIIVAGGGPVGLATAALIATGPVADRCRVTVIDAAPRRRFDKAATDLRVYALSRSAQGILARCGAWQAIAATRVSPYCRMQIWEGEQFDSAGRLRFDSADIGEPDLGHIVEDSLICASLYDVLDRADTVELVTGTGIDSVEYERHRVLVHTEGAAATRSATLLIAADGGRSPIREAAGLPRIERDYRQCGVIAHVVPQHAHARTAWQRFLPGGPLALLPLSDGRCSIVWSLPTPASQQLLEAPREAFDAQLTQASANVLGRLSLDSNPVALPLVARHAWRYCRPRLALAGDAAHTVHPLAGQGVNLGLADAAELARTIAAAVTAGQDPGDLRVLQRYERARTVPNMLMLGALDGLDRLFTAPGVLAPLRAAGLRVVDGIAPLKRELIRYASGGSVMSQ